MRLEREGRKYELFYQLKILYKTPTWQFPVCKSVLARVPILAAQKSGADTPFPRLAVPLNYETPVAVWNVSLATGGKSQQNDFVPLNWIICRNPETRSEHSATSQKNGRRDTSCNRTAIKYSHVLQRLSRYSKIRDAYRNPARLKKYEHKTFGGFAFPMPEFPIIKELDHSETSTKATLSLVFLQACPTVLSSTDPP